MKQSFNQWWKFIWDLSPKPEDSQSFDSEKTSPKISVLLRTTRTEGERLLNSEWPYCRKQKKIFTSYDDCSGEEWGRLCSYERDGWLFDGVVQGKLWSSSSNTARPPVSTQIFVARHEFCCSIKGHRPSSLTNSPNECYPHKFPNPKMKFSTVFAILSTTIVGALAESHKVHFNNKCGTGTVRLASSAKHQVSHWHSKMIISQCSFKDLMSSLPDKILLVMDHSYPRLRQFQVI